MPIIKTTTITATPKSAIQKKKKNKKTTILAQLQESEV